MKKTLAIVLALVMVLAMIPAMSAATTLATVTDKQYDIEVYNWNKTVLGDLKGSATKANAVEAKYNFEDENADVTGKWTEDAKMAVVAVKGFELDAVASSVKVDGKALATSSYAEYIPGYCGYDPAAHTVWFPVELTKAGYSDTYVIEVVGKEGDITITETAKVSVKLINTAEYKDAKTAIITNIAAQDAADLSAYIVGDKIYLDYVAKTVTDEKIKITFGDENGAAFTAITYAYNPTVDSAIGLPGGAVEVKLDKSAAIFNVNGQPTTDTQFKLETKAALYETKKYDIVVRTGIVEEDPKGIYFAETTKTIAMGQTYTPVVVGVKTGKPVAATIKFGTNIDAEVIDIEGNTVIGTREGVAYITAEYKAAGQATKYTSSSMKIVVTLPGESIPALDPAAEIYYVTCRALNVRAGAGTSYKKVDLIHRGDAVKVVELKNGWAKLADGTYVCAKYIAK